MLGLHGEGCVPLEDGGSSRREFIVMGVVQPGQRVRQLSQFSIGICGVLRE